MWEKFVGCFKTTGKSGAQVCNTIKLSDLYHRVPLNQRKQFKAFAKKNEMYKERVRKYPDKMPRINWKYYQMNVRSGYVDWVKDFERKYDKLDSLFENRFATMDPTPYFAEVDKETEELKERIAEFKKYSNKRIAALQKEFDRINCMTPYEKMTMEEFCISRPEVAPDFINKPTFWPHNPEEQTPGPSDPEAALELHAEEHPPPSAPPSKPPPSGSPLVAEAVALDAPLPKPKECIKLNPDLHKSKLSADDFAEQLEVMARKLLADALKVSKELAAKVQGYMEIMIKKMQKMNSKLKESTSTPKSITECNKNETFDSSHIKPKHVKLGQKPCPDDILQEKECLAAVDVMPCRKKEKKVCPEKTESTCIEKSTEPKIDKCQVKKKKKDDNDDGNDGNGGGGGSCHGGNITDGKKSDKKTFNEKTNTGPICPEKPITNKTDTTCLTGNAGGTECDNRIGNEFDKPNLPTNSPSYIAADSFGTSTVLGKIHVTEDSDKKNDKLNSEQVDQSKVRKKPEGPDSIKNITDGNETEEPVYVSSRQIDELFSKSAVPPSPTPTEPKLEEPSQSKSQEDGVEIKESDHLKLSEVESIRQTQILTTLPDVTPLEENTVSSSESTPDSTTPRESHHLVDLLKKTSTNIERLGQVAQEKKEPQSILSKRVQTIGAKPAKVDPLDDVTKKLFVIANSADKLLNDAMKTLEKISNDPAKIEIMEQALKSAEDQANRALEEALKAVKAAEKLSLRKSKQKDKKALLLSEKHVQLVKLLVDRAINLKEQIAKISEQVRKAKK